MKPTSRTEVHPSPAPELRPERSLIPDGPVAAKRRDSRSAAPATTPDAARRTPFARLLAALRGDKYMIDAYPPTASPPKDG